MPEALAGRRARAGPPWGRRPGCPAVPARVAARNAGRRHRQAKPSRKDASQGSRSGVGPGPDLDEDEQGDCRDTTKVAASRPKATGKPPAVAARKPASGGPRVQARVRTNCRRELTTTRALSVASVGQPRLETGIEGDGEAPHQEGGGEHHPHLGDAGGRGHCRGRRRPPPGPGRRRPGCGAAGPGRGARPTAKPNSRVGRVSRAVVRPRSRADPVRWTMNRGSASRAT